MTRVAIVAATASVRERLQSIVASADSQILSAAAASVAELASDAGLASSEVVLLHARTPLSTRDLHGLPPIPVIVLIGATAPRPAAGDILAAGARGVLADDASRDEIVAAIDAAAAGLVVVPPELVGELAVSRASPSATPGSGSPAQAPAPPLTPREREILAMLADGLPNKVIAARLAISEHTVKTHLEAIFDKLGASTRAEAVARGVRSGLLLL